MRDFYTTETKEEREAVYRFRYEQYIENLGRVLPGIDDKRRMLREPHDEDSRHTYIKDNRGDICAVVTETPLTCRHIPGRWEEIFDLEGFEGVDPAHITVTSRLILRPDFRRSTMLGRLLCHMYRRACEKGCEINLIYCASTLVGMYEQLGFRRYTDNFNTSDLGAYRIPMILVMGDLEHLKKVRSPFYKIGLKLDPLETHLARLFNNFPKLTAAINTRLMSEEALYERIATDTLRNSGQSAPPVFDGLNKEEIQSVLHRSVILDVNKGDCIIRQGDSAREIFLVIKGLYEIFLSNLENSFSLGVLGPGDVMGELSYFQSQRRTANVNALTDGQLLVFNQDFLDNLSSRNPEITITILNNLLRILARRMSATDQYLLESLN